MILAGDIGGTHTRLAVFREDPLRAPPLFIEVFPSREHRGLVEIVRSFLGRHDLHVEAACFGIAGPVLNGRVEASNLPWIVDARQLAEELQLKCVILINDLEANAHGIAVLQPSDFVVLQEGVAAPHGAQALISAGTGLGEAWLVAECSGYRPLPSEGGHADFAPRNELEIELLRRLLLRFEHVSYERVLSGPGLYNIYLFLRDTGRGAEPPWLAEEIARGDPPAVISANALKGASELCVQALDLFVSIYGAEAGNLALRVLATGGVFIGGGIAPRIAGKLQDPVFLKSFTSKGRVSKLLETIPVRLIINDKTALLGAARVAAAALQKHAK
jgi:glucokinase